MPPTSPDSESPEAASSEPAPRGDCYSASERSAMEWTQRLRGRWLAPFLDRATRMGLTADHVTLASLVAGLAAAGCLALRDVRSGWLPLGLVALALHVLLDGIDGPLARYQRSASRRGSFTDTCADQVVVTAVTLGLAAGADPALNPLVGGAYVFVYTMVVGFAMVRNALGVPYSWLVRPRFWVYGWIAVDAYLWPRTLDVVVAVFSLLLLVKLVTGFCALRRLL